MTSMSQIDSYFYEKFFDGLSPSYILDDNFNFISWNRAFDAIFAQPFALKVGMHAAKFVDFMENSKEILDRSIKVFGMGNFPKVDIEPLRFKNDQFGNFSFYKLASQFSHPETGEDLWLVHLIPYECDNFVDLVEEISKAIESSI